MHIDPSQMEDMAGTLLAAGVLFGMFFGWLLGWLMAQPTKSMKTVLRETIDRRLESSEVLPDSMRDVLRRQRDRWD